MLTAESTSEGERDLRSLKRWVALLVWGMVFYSLLPDKAINGWTAGHLDPNGRLAGLELRTGGFAISIYRKWKPGGDANSRIAILGFLLADEAHVGVPPWENRLTVEIPWWSIAAIFVARAFVHLTTRAMRRARERKAERTGACPVCGYDLRATRNRCPECGTEIRISSK